MLAVLLLGGIRELWVTDGAPTGTGRKLWQWEPPLFSDGFEDGGTGAWSATAP